MRRQISRAFGWAECAIALCLVALMTWEIGRTLVARTEAPQWLRPVNGVWT